MSSYVVLSCLPVITHNSATQGSPLCKEIVKGRCREIKHICINPFSSILFSQLKRPESKAKIWHFHFIDSQLLKQLSLPATLLTDTTGRLFEVNLTLYCESYTYVSVSFYHIPLFLSSLKSKCHVIL